MLSVYRVVAIHRTRGSDGQRSEPESVVTCEVLSLDAALLCWDLQPTQYMSSTSISRRLVVQQELTEAKKGECAQAAPGFVSDFTAIENDRFEAEVIFRDAE